jgi:hypothetical protein
MVNETSILESLILGLTISAGLITSAFISTKMILNRVESYLLGSPGTTKKPRTENKKSQEEDDVW